MLLQSDECSHGSLVPQTDIPAKYVLRFRHSCSSYGSFQIPPREGEYSAEVASIIFIGIMYHFTHIV